MTDATPMTRHEREDLQRLIRQREKVMKSAARQRSVDLIADFEAQIGAEYRFDDDAVWKEAAKAAEIEVAKAAAVVAERCMELGIPAEFAPGLSLGWRHRGYNNALKERRQELRKIAEARVKAMEQAAIVRIEQASVEAQTRLAIAGMTGAAALAFVEDLPKVESMMERLSFADLAGKATPPLAQQLVSNPAERAAYMARIAQAALEDSDDD